MQRLLLFLPLLLCLACQQDAENSGGSNSGVADSAVANSTTTNSEVTDSDLVPAGYELVWNDEFDYQGLPDDTKWGYQPGGHGWGRSELQTYTDARVENANVSNGHLTITARKEQVGRNAYTSARVVTKRKADFTYGYFEIRAKMPAGRGVWPSIWMVGDTVSKIGWPNAGQIDIVEHFGFFSDSIFATAQAFDYNLPNGTARKRGHYVPSAETDFNTYGLLWTETELNWYVNGQLFHQEIRPSTSGPINWPFQWPFYMIFSITVGGDLGGLQGVDDAAFPAELAVDYVRVYQAR